MTKLKDYLIVFTAIFSTILFLFFIWEACQDGTVVKEEIILPEIPHVHCLNWDEMAAKYNISGMVLLEAMLDKCPS